MSKAIIFKAKITTSCAIARSYADTQWQLSDTKVEPFALSLRTESAKAKAVPFQEVSRNLLYGRRAL